MARKVATTTAATTKTERTLLVRDKDGEFRITIPADAHVTFGPDVPFSPKQPAYAEVQRAYSLRVYADRTKESLMAVFSRVEWFRDLSIPHAKLVVRESGKSLWKSDETGYEVNTSVKHDQSFVDSARLLGE